MSTLRMAAGFCSAALAFPAGCAVSHGMSGVEVEMRNRDAFEVRTIRLHVDEHEYDARLYVPDAAATRGVGVVLIGGGLGNDLDWGTPGALPVNGSSVRTTISGEPHADAPRLAHAFATHGGTVLHWSTLARDDPKRELWPLDMTPVSMDALVEQAKAAIAAIRAVPSVDPDRIVLVGHSLGGYRATGIAATDSGIAGLVLIGSASLTRTALDDRGRNAQRADARERLASLDADGNGTVERTEAGASALAADFDRIDFDGDGVLRAWEISADLARDARRTLELSSDGPPETDQWGGLVWGEDLIVRRRIPTLILYGGLDEAQAHHAPIIADRIAEYGAGHVRLVVIPDLGHSMGRDRDGLIAPFDEEALAVIEAWFVQFYPRYLE